MRRKREASGMVRVRVLGAVELQVGHRRIGMNTEVLFALALYLTTRSGERVSREELLELFWSKGTDSQRRHALRQMLYRLRQKGLVVEEHGDHVRVAPEQVDSDLRFALDEEWIEKASTAQIDAAGGALPTFSRRMAAGFVTWLDDVRNLVNAQHRKAALRQITVARREARWGDLERWAQAVLRSDPLNEEATLARAESAAMAGSKTVALEILDEYLMEVGEISPDLGKPARSLRKRLAERRSDWTLRGPKEVPLVGRREQMTRLTGLAEAAWHGAGSAMVLVGPPGIGKTRLAMETRAYAELKGMRTVVVRAEIGQSERPLGVILSLIPQLVGLPGAAGSDPSALALLTRMINQQGRSQSEPSLSHDPMRDAILAALDEVVAAIASECRLLILIDDAHHVDVESVPLLSRLAMRTNGRRVSWLATSRDDRLTGALSGTNSPPFTAYRVPPLDKLDSEALVQSVLSAHRLTLSAASISGIADMSGGNPLFVREIGAHRATTGQEAGMPSTLKSLISDRIGRFDAGLLRLVRTVSLLGSSATLSRVRSMASPFVKDTTEALELLEGEGLVSMVSGRIALHECWQQAISEGMRVATRASLALECAELLRADSLSPGIETKWRAAELYALAGEASSAIECFITAADEMLQLGFPDEAVTILDRAATLCQRADQRLAVTRRLAEAHSARGEHAEVLRATEEVAVEHAWGLSPAGVNDLTVSICHRADALVVTHENIDRELRFITEVARAESSPALAKQIACYTGIRRALLRQDRPLARAFFDYSRERANEDGAQFAAQLVRLIYAAEFGSIGEIADASDALGRIPAPNNSLKLQCNSLRFRAHALRMAGALEDAIALGEEAFGVASRYRQHDVAANTAESLTFLHLDTGDLEGAERWLSAGRGFPNLPPHGTRDRGLRHAEARLALQRGQYDVVWSMLRDALDHAQSDTIMSRRCGELLTFALAAAKCGEREWALREAEQARRSLEVADAEFLLDYPNEMLVRTLNELGEESAAASHADRYLTARSISYSRPFPPFYRALSERQSSFYRAAATSTES